MTQQFPFLWISCLCCLILLKGYSARLESQKMPEVQSCPLKAKENSKCRQTETISSIGGIGNVLKETKDSLGEDSKKEPGDANGAGNNAVKDASKDHRDNVEKLNEMIEKAAGMIENVEDFEEIIEYISDENEEEETLPELEEIIKGHKEDTQSKHIEPESTLEAQKDLEEQTTLEGKTPLERHNESLGTKKEKVEKAPPPPPKLEKLPDVETLLALEEEMLTFVKEYIEDEKLQLETLDTNLAHWMAMSDYSMADPEKFLSTYMNCFHVLKRMVFDVQTQILNYSLYGDQTKDEGLSRWDIYNESHHLISYVNSSANQEQVLNSLDTHIVLILLMSDTQGLSIPETQLIDLLVKSLDKPYDAEFITKDQLLLGLTHYLHRLEQRGRTELKDNLTESILAKYPDYQYDYFLQYVTQRPAETSSPKPTEASS